MKVAFIGSKGLPSKGGGERVIEALVKRMTLKDVSPTIYCDKSYTPPDFHIKGVKLIRLPAIQGKYTRTFTLVLLSTLHALIFGKYDLIHLHNIEVSFVLPLLRMKFKVLSTGHGFAYRTAKWSSIAKKIMKAMDYFFVNYSSVISSVSAEHARDLESRFGRRVLHIPNGVESEQKVDSDKAEAILLSHGLQKNGYLIFVAGRIEPIKGAHLAIEAVNKLSGDIPLLVVGDNNQVKKYGETLHKIAGPKIHFQPLIEDPSVLFGLMKHSICLIFPSLVEAMSMVLLEAASFGVPIICSDIAENKDVLGADGIYFKSGNISSLLEKLKYLLENRHNINLNARKLQEHVLHKYSWDSVASQYIQVYKAAIF